MVRTNLKQIKKYFKYFESENKSSCTLGKCKAVISGNHAPNLERQVKRFYDKEFNDEKLSGLQQPTGASFSNEPQKKRMRETNQCAIESIDEMFLKTIQVKMNEKTLENACLGLVTIKGRPFKIMDDSGFRKNLNLLLEGMRAKFTVNAENIREKIGEKANVVRNRMQLEVECKLVPSKLTP